MGAGLFSVEELALNPDEAKQLADAITEVNTLYDASIIPPEIMAWINLVTTCGIIYGPRIVAISARPKGQRQQQTKKPWKQPVVINAVAKEKEQQPVTANVATT